MEESSVKSSPSILAILCIILAFATVAYGAVDTSSLGVIAVLIAIMSLIWVSRLISQHELPINTNVLLLPIVGLIVIGSIQLLPLGTGNTSGAPANGVSSEFIT